MRTFKEQEKLIRSLRKENKMLQERINIESNKSYRFRNYCSQIVDCMSSCKNNETVSNDHWLKKSKELWG